MKEGAPGMGTSGARRRTVLGAAVVHALQAVHLAQATFRAECCFQCRLHLLQRNPSVFPPAFPPDEQRGYRIVVADPVPRGDRGHRSASFAARAVSAVFNFANASTAAAREPRRC